MQAPTAADASRLRALGWLAAAVPCCVSGPHPCVPPGFLRTGFTMVSTALRTSVRATAGSAANWMRDAARQQQACLISRLRIETAASDAALASPLQANCGRGHAKLPVSEGLQCLHAEGGAGGKAAAGLLTATS